ncbi:hypothetical protein [Actinomadura harenae]|uniref:Uncharacterized protein n=1 Tax=Actinomadura harenae TaxID=2483351 RepID=A0A3M2MD07_9ACTN|nr:hypothetical protein [Actinomadura harenae]RMI47604.1 hypothetical protein EBO15_01500 [Actinomadura harenae]
MSTPTPPDVLLTAPYVAVAAFRAAPTWLDSDDLIPGGTATKQDAELYNVLLRASAWADNQCNQSLGAAPHTQQRNVRPNRRGDIVIHASSVPVRQVTAVSLGAGPASLSPLSDLSGVWVEDGRSIHITNPARTNWAGWLEFGTAAPGRDMLASITYTAGYASATLTAAASSGATAVTVSTPSGIFPGDVLRIWDPGLEEAVIVAPGYTPGSSTVPLATPLGQTHAAGAGVSGLPADVHQAVICYTVALLMREDVSSQAPFAEAPFGPAARTASSGGQAGGLVNEAERLLMPYRRVR